MNTSVPEFLFKKCFIKRIQSTKIIKNKQNRDAKSIPGNSPKFVDVFMFFFFWSESDLVIIDDMLHSMHFFRGLLNHSYLKVYYKEKNIDFSFFFFFSSN